MDFSAIALLIVIASLGGIAAKLLRQPLFLGYLIAGAILINTHIISDTVSLQNLGQIGVTLLLFLLGLEMNPRDLASVGKTAVITGIIQVIVTAVLSYIFALALGFPAIASLYLAFALTFSSTIVAIKLLSEKKDLASLYGKLTVGILLVQDFIAIFLLMIVTSLGRGGNNIIFYLLAGFKILLLCAFLIVISRKILPKIFEKIVSSSPELIFTVSLGWALGIAYLVSGPLNFSAEIGGFLAGLALSSLPEHLQISARTRPIRDFFLTIFFLYLGTQLVISQNIILILLPALFFSVFVLIFHPLITFFLLCFYGYRKKTAFMTGLSISQISEFSFILMAAGLFLGHVTQQDISIILITGVITMMVSTYLIVNADILYARIACKLNFFERKITIEQVLRNEINKTGHVILVGCDRTGRELSTFFQNNSIDFVVIDYNPLVHTRLTANRIPIIFGDVNDAEILEAASISTASLIITTFSKLKDNLFLLDYLKNNNLSTATIFTALSKDDAVRLYESGAGYVIVPEIVAGEHLRHVLEVPGIIDLLKNIGKKSYDNLLVSSR